MCPASNVHQVRSREAISRVAVLNEPDLLSEPTGTLQLNRQAAKPVDIASKMIRQGQAAGYTIV